MIFQAIPPHGAVPAVALVAAEHAATSRTFEYGVSGTAPLEPLTVAEAHEGDAVQFQPQIREVMEEFDWGSPRTQRELIRLEQKVLARKANEDEKHRYQVMRRDRNSVIFADRALRDYAEVQRLKKLSEKLAEIQQYLRPFEI